jgi:hypothetical protein
MKIGKRWPLNGLIANEPVNTPVLSRVSVCRSRSDLASANSRYRRTASGGGSVSPKMPFQESIALLDQSGPIVSSGHSLAVMSSTSGCSGASTM